MCHVSIITNWIVEYCSDFVFDLLFFFFLLFSSNLESVSQFAALKIAKWHLLTWSQLCLSPSHFKHSPTLLMLSQRGRRSLNTKVDEVLLIKKRGEIWAAVKQLTLQVVQLLAGACWMNECGLTLSLPLLLWTWATREKKQLLWRRVCFMKFTSNT